MPTNFDEMTEAEYEAYVNRRTLEGEIERRRRALVEVADTLITRLQRNIKTLGGTEDRLGQVGRRHEVNGVGELQAYGAEYDRLCGEYETLKEVHEMLYRTRVTVTTGLKPAAKG